MFKDEALLESKSLRESLAERTDVLDKVKKLVLLPDDVNASVEMVADYYEVGKKAIESLIFDNRNEVEADGLRVLSGEELIFFKEMAIISKMTRSFTIIPRRAILRIGMLLRDSLVAREVRTHLLNVEAGEPKPQSEKERLRDVMRMSLIQYEEIENLKVDVTEVKDRIDEIVNHMRIDGSEEFRLRNSGQKKVLEVLGGTKSPAYAEVGRKAFAELWRDFKQYFHLSRYGDLPKTRFDDGMYFISKWRPSTSLEIEIEQCNRQVQLRIVKSGADHYELN